MIIVNQELKGKNLLTNKFSQFKDITIKKDCIHTLIYYEQIPLIEDLESLTNLENITLYSSNIVLYWPVIDSYTIQQFLLKIFQLEKLKYLSVIGYNLHVSNTNFNIECLNNLPIGLEYLEFSYTPPIRNLFLQNLPICLKEVKIEMDYAGVIAHNDLNALINIIYSNCKIPFDCEIILVDCLQIFSRYTRSFSISDIKSKNNLI